MNIDDSTATVSLAEAALAIGITPEELLDASAKPGLWQPQAFLVGGEWRVPEVEVRGARLEMHRKNLRPRADSGEGDG